MAWDLTNPGDVSRLRSILLKGSDASRVVAQSFDQALAALAAAYPHLGETGRRGQPADDDNDDDQDGGLDDLSSVMSAAVQALQAVRPPAPMTFPLSPAALKALLDKCDREGPTQ